MGNQQQQRKQQQQQQQKKPSKLTMRGKPKLRIKICGPSVGEARLSAWDMAEIMRRTQQALKRIGQVLFGQESVGKGRKKKEIEELCELYVTAWEPGSAVATLDLTEPSAQLDLFKHVGEESLEAFVNGIGQISKKKAKPKALPKGFDTGVLQTCNALGAVLEHGIDTVAFYSENGKESFQADYDTEVRSTIRKLLGEPFEVDKTSKTGRLEILDGHKKLAGTLWEPNGTKWTCLFKEEHAEILADSWLKTVRVTGKATIEGGKQSLEVDSILVTDEEFLSTRSPGEAFPFWETTPLDELIKQQQVSPVEDIDNLGALWPADDDPDRFLEHVLKERGERRRLVKNNEGETK